MTSIAERIRRRERNVRKAIAHAEHEADVIPYWRRELHQLAAQLRHVHHEIPLPRYGVDYAWERPSLVGLREHGVTFAARYLTGEGKALDRAEAHSLSLADIDIVSVFEEGARAMAAGDGQGALDGARARAAAEAIGMPRGRPIYFACDFEAAGHELAQVVNYLHAAADHLGPYHVGIYGGLQAVRTALNAGCRWAWQTLAWSAGQWEPRAQLRQTSITGPVIEGIVCDTDWAHALDYGGWRLP